MTDITKNCSCCKNRPICIYIEKINEFWLDLEWPREPNIEKCDLAKIIKEFVAKHCVRFEVHKQ